VKVLLIQPPIEDFYDTRIRTYPLGILYLATKIRDICDVSILDFRSNSRYELRTDPFFDDLKPFYVKNIITPFSFFQSYHRFGLKPDAILKILKKERPDLIGISSLFTTYSIEALEIAKIIKEVNNDTITVMGGCHPTVFPEEVMKNEFVDFVIRGDGETPLFRLINLLKSGKQDYEDVRGLCYKKDGRTYVSGINAEDNVDMVPDRKLLCSERYKIGKDPYTFFLTSRGCPFKCNFCGKPDTPYRRRSIKSIGDEINDCIAQGINSIDFEDDMLNLDKNYFQEILKLCVGKNLTLSAMNGIYPHTMDIETLDLMSQAGFRRLNFSLIDISQSIVSDQKRIFPKQFLDILNYIEDSAFLTEIHFIIGLPGQSPADVIDTIIFLMERRVLLGPSIFYLAPGSKIFNEYSPAISGNFNRQSCVKAYRSSFMLPVNPVFERTITFTLVKLVRAINYIKQLVDKNPEAERLSDLPHLFKNSTEQEIVRTLITEKRFIAYDHGKKDFITEQQDEDLVKLFFNTARRKTIKGFKTGNKIGVN
jgi:anaerobic magnesium-protoporphyrin IX monomethyl ester cyclase